ncbi:MAG TPA: ADOP family duplicated permease [Vicinamibacteria bacterium]|nr:ADOP family duplicated permease [Vicinamibacteria bacterium]
MRAAARLASLWRGLFRRGRMEAELDEELAASFEELVARLTAAGLSPAEARRAAAREMGNPTHLKLAVREAWVVSPWDAAAQDARQAWRGLRGTPVLTGLAVATLALGIGATAAILAVVRATLLTPPPYRDPERLVLVWADLTAAGHPRVPLSGPELSDLRQRTTSFEGLAGIWAGSVTLGEQGEPEFVRIGLVTDDFFPLLGVDAAAGRTFAPTDAMAGPPTTILLSSQLWQRRFGADPDVVGRAITVDGRPTLVIGVLPERFRLALPPDAGIPDTIEAFQLLDRRIPEAPRGQRFVRVVGRRRPGVSLHEASQDVDRVAAQLSREFPSPHGSAFVTVELGSENTRRVRGPVLAVAASVGLLLAIAAVNVLGVLVARAAARRREIALRVVMGAGLLRTLRLALAEGLLLATLGTILGIGVGHVALTALLAWRPEALRLGEATLDARVLAVTSALAMLWGLLFALAPLREHARANPVALLAGARGEERRVGASVRAGLVIAQVALTLVLLVASGLLARSFARIQAIDPGFRAAGVLTFRVPSATPRHASPEAREELAHSLGARLRALPSVTSVGAVSHLPYDSIPNWGGPFSPDPDTGQALPNADYRSVSPGFFEAAGVTLLEGRDFTDDDRAGSEPVAVVDDRLAARAWPGRSALGQRLRVDPFSTGAASVWVRVVGVVRHVRHRSLIEALNEQVYFPLGQAFRNPVAYLVRSSADASALAPAIRAAVQEVDPSLPIYEVRPLSAYLERARSVQRFAMVLVAAFAGTALVLAAIGVYGVVAYTVVQRRREFGVRRALGATRGQIRNLVLLDGAKLTGAGAALGLAGAGVAARLLRSQLWGVSAADALTYAAVLPVVAAAALLACWWPARRATSAEVLDVLRAE